MAYNYADLMAQLQAYRQQNSGAQIMSDEMGRPLFNEDGTARMTGGVDPNSINDWNNGLTGNQGVSYAYDPASDSFRVVQGDATSGFQRYAVNQQGLQDLGFEDYDRNGRMQNQWGTMAALAAGTAALAYVAPMMEAWAASSGLSPGAQGTLAADGSFAFGSPAQAQAAATWGSGGAAEVAGGAGASALSGGAPAASGGLTMEGILGSNFASNPMGIPGAEGSLSAGAMYGAPATVAGASAAMQGLPNTGPIDTGLSGNLGVPAGAAPGVSVPTGTAPRPGQPQQGGPQQNPNQSVLEQLMGGNLNMDGLMRLLSGAIGASQQNRFADQLLQRANDATPNRGFYEGQLRQTYENPGAFLQSPEYQAIQDITHNKLQRSDAAGGRLANDYGRQIGLQNNAMSQLDQHRRTLSGITGQNQQTYSGQNSMFMQGAQADNSWMNGILSSLMSRPQGNTGAPNTGGFNFGQIPNLFQGSGTTPQINLDAIA